MSFNDLAEAEVKRWITAESQSTRGFIDLNYPWSYFVTLFRCADTGLKVKIGQKLTLKGKMFAKFSSAEFSSYCVLDELPSHLSLVFRFQMNVYFASQGVGLLGSS